MEEYDPIILYHPGKKSILVNIFPPLPCGNVLQIPKGKSSPVILFNFTPEGFNISNDYDQLKGFLDLRIPDITENNPVDLKYLYIQQNMGVKFVTKATKYPRTILQQADWWLHYCVSFPPEQGLLI